MMRYRREPPRSLSDLVQQVGATHVIEGSVRRSGQDVRVTLQLIDARTIGTNGRKATIALSAMP